MQTTQLRERAVILLLLVVGVAACKSAAPKGDPAALMREANALLRESNETTAQWTAEYGKAFMPQERAQFPANRESLRAHADSITKILNENATQCNRALEKYDQSIALMKDEQQRKGAASLVSALRTSMKINELIKSQMQLVSDEKIVDGKTFNEKFLELLKPVTQMENERRAQFEEGRRLLGM